MRVRKTPEAGDEGEWEDDTNFPSKQTLPATQLTAVRTDEDDANIQLYYQDLDGSVKEMKYISDAKGWHEDETGIQDAQPGTSLFALCGGNNFETRLYYQDEQNKLQERYTNTMENWRNSKIRTFELAPKAPIGAVAWSYDTKVDEFMGQRKCPQRYVWKKEGEGYRCSAGGHYKSYEDARADAKAEGVI
ncbi:hypothetical protein N7519_003914 [Penicillium mononematosum]|uniref:uncharacterized protein n=1 Tax=Penicillium mononematosum TaxID=268346 RepID=UPI0025489E52|nr:uncharacterized protein N7519_003914 [Penicillium mononematosum]KAJ6189006.1 hypothetical protein N7519_003914 [Penicillium mononematosum]